jgi:hypothetical protein
MTYRTLRFGAIILGLCMGTPNVHATAAVGFTGTTIANSQFGDLDNFNHALPVNGAPWLALLKTKGSSDLYVQSNVWQPGGHTGWHSHPGASLIIVTEGTLTVYDAADKSCKPSVYTRGMGFVDHGGEHSHLVRNEGSAAATGVAVQLIPRAAMRRIDVPDPGNCVFTSPASTAAVATPRNATVVTRELQLAGTGSTSADGKGLRYQWSIPAGSPSAAIRGGDTAMPVVQFGATRGVYKFQLTVTDSSGGAATDTVAVTFAGICGRSRVAIIAAPAPVRCAPNVTRSF